MNNNDLILVFTSGYGKNSSLSFAYEKFLFNMLTKKDMIEAENKIFEDARLEMMKEENQLLMNQNLNEDNEANEENGNEIDNNENEKEKNEDNAKLDKNLFIDNGGEEDINFD